MTTPLLEIDDLHVTAGEGARAVEMHRLDGLGPDRVHILVDGRIVESGGPDLAVRLSREGYDAWR